MFERGLAILIEKRSLDWATNARSRARLRQPGTRLSDPIEAVFMLSATVIGAMTP